MSTSTADETPHIGLVTVSDRASRGEYEDRSGPALKSYLERAFLPPWKSSGHLIPDDPDRLANLLRSLCDDESCALVLTSGGTGPSLRDFTPDVTADVCDRLLPGFAEEMRRVSRLEVATAILSRQVVGHRGRSLIVNLPGSPRAIGTCLDAILPVLPHCLAQIGAPPLRLNPERHTEAANPHPHPAEGS